MIFTSYTSLGDFQFKDDYNTVKRKISSSEFVETKQDFIGDIREVLLLNSANLKIVFKKDCKSIDYFELFEGDFVFEGKDLFKLDFDELINHLQKYDEEIDVSEEEVVSKKLGIQITKNLIDDEYVDSIENILIFSRDYLEQQEALGDDILKYYLGYNPFTEEQKDKTDF